jgi:hypothetical protein
MLEVNRYKKKHGSISNKNIVIEIDMILFLTDKNRIHVN